ncbi:MAG: hypothetical protein ACRYFZ_01815 [Janthinobacterium lividum]
MNPKTAHSQVMGGSIFGIGAALIEENLRDPNLASYHVPVNADLSSMTVEFIDKHAPYVNALGVPAALANAVFRATCRRLRSLPMTPDKVLAAKCQPA